MKLRNVLARLRRRDAPAAPSPETLAAAFANTMTFTRGAGREQRAGKLAEYFDAHREGRGIWKWRHYFEIYERHLAKYAGSDAHVVEIGVYSGGSLQMWRHYFGPAAQIAGVDIEEACRAYAEPGTSIVIGDQADREFWRRFRNEHPRVDVLIDDGGHTYEQQRITLEEMLPHIQPGGVYLCEDVHGIDNEFAAYARALAAQLNTFDTIPAERSDGELATTALPFQQAIRSVHLYPYVVVIEKNDERVERFVAPRHGTHWEPFL